MTPSAAESPMPHDRPAATRTPVGAGVLPQGPELPNVLQMLGMGLVPTEFLDHCARRYGHTFTLRIFGELPLVAIADPQAIKEIFTGDPKILHAGKANLSLAALLGSNSLLTLDGVRHLEERRLLLPPFHGERMIAYGASMAQIAASFAEKFPKGRPFSLHRELSAITLEIILHTVMGFVEGNPRLPAMRTAIHDLLEVAKNPLWLVKPLRVDLGRRSVWGQLTAMLKTVDELLYREIRERRANVASRPNDVLSLLLQARYEDGTAMSDIALRDEMITLLVAGHETTATALAWIFQYVLRDPETQHDLEDEIARHGSTDLYASLANMPLLDSVVKETLRLRPVVPHVARHAQEDISIGGRVYQAGTRFLPSAYLTHRRADLWPEATVFRPRRFIDVKPSPYEYFPFGGGTRRCIGMAFALYEIKVVALTLLQQDMKMRLVRNTFPRAVRRSLTFAPAGGTEVIGA